MKLNIAFSYKKYTCIVDTIYSLFFYLLLCKDINDIKRTKFFLGETISDDVAANISDYIRIPSWHLTRRKIKRLRLKSILFWRLPMLFTEIYSLDHLPMNSIIIGLQRYTLIEDGPTVFSCVDNNEVLKPFTIKGSVIRRLKTRLIYGPLFGHSFGTSWLCKNRIISTQEDLNSPYLINKKYTLVDIENSWNAASDEKKSFILSLFNFSWSSLNECKGKDTIILTQPFIQDRGLSEEEQVELYRPFIEKYKENGVVIKPHPRDFIDYKEHFSYITFLNTKMPMQMFSIMGVKFKRAVTVCSSAISAFDKECEIVWLGTNIDERIFQHFGNQTNNF